MSSIGNCVGCSEVVGGDLYNTPPKPAKTNYKDLLVTGGNAVTGIISALTGNKGNTNVPASTTPTWIMPAIIGGVGLLAVLVISSKKKRAVNA